MTAKHLPDVEFTETVSQALQAASDRQAILAEAIGERMDGASEEANADVSGPLRGMRQKGSGAVPSTSLPIRTI